MNPLTPNRWWLSYFNLSESLRFNSTPREAGGANNAPASNHGK
jgi:hypothetical protein